MERKIAFIINPISGTSNKKRIVDYLHSVICNFPDIYFSFHISRSAEDPYNLASQLKDENYDAVVAIGGDGTVNQIAHALVGSKTKLGIIPVGSGNGLARFLGIPLNYEKAFENIVADNVKIIDAGLINNRLFFCTAGIGFEASVGDKFNNTKSRGLFSYITSCISVYSHYKLEKYKVKIDNKEFSKEAFLITFANCSQWGNNVYIAPMASITDGMLDVVIWKRSPMFLMPFLASMLFFKNINNSEFIDSYRCKSLVIERERDGLVQYDGESLMMNRRLEVSVLPQSVRVIVPVS